ncbi:MAG: hypothetical protein Ct9H300mP21_04210 [Pseudomonadota bacterium]|nr:MAG: hypothetical protein Ct9H300mP21_04210 [Pseudomonadota bacterium]
MGPAVRSLGPWVPDEELLWQDPVPAVDHTLINDADSGLSKPRSSAQICRLTVSLDAWAPPQATVIRISEVGERRTDSPFTQAEWDVNVTSGVAQVVAILEGIQQEFNNSQTGGRKFRLPI